MKKTPISAFDEQVTQRALHLLAIMREKGVDTSLIAGYIKNEVYIDSWLFGQLLRESDQDCFEWNEERGCYRRTYSHREDVVHLVITYYVYVLDEVELSFNSRMIREDDLVIKNIYQSIYN